MISKKNKSVVVFNKLVTIPNEFNVEYHVWRNLFPDIRLQETIAMINLPLVFGQVASVTIYDAADIHFKNWLGLFRLSNELPFYSLDDDGCKNFFHVVSEIEKAKKYCSDKWGEELTKNLKISLDSYEEEIELVEEKFKLQQQLLEIENRKNKMESKRKEAQRIIGLNTKRRKTLIREVIARCKR